VNAKTGLYCVLCGADHTPRNGLKRCPRSELGMSHLWTQEGFVRPWFKVKRPSGETATE
jgi:hypothetical protein